jgi:hypothetical protein
LRSAIFVRRWLGRRETPADAERATLQNHFKGARDGVVSCRDLPWALVNSTEFSKLHNLDLDVVGSLQPLNRLAAGWDLPPDGNGKSSIEPG